MRQFLATLVCMMALTSCYSNPNTPKITAHRGFWKCEGGGQNTISSLVNAAEAETWGSEFDVWMTADDSLVVTHDSKHNGLRVKDVTLEELRQYPTTNGETLSTATQYLEKALEFPDLHLVFEVKTPSGPTDTLYESRIAPACVELVKKYGLEDRTTFIAFSLTLCERLAKLVPDMCVQYLNGDLAPKDVYARGIKGIDYHYGVLLLHPEWVRQAQELGMVVNCWTVNAPVIINKMCDLGVDQITTDEPTLAQKILRKRDL